MAARSSMKIDLQTYGLFIILWHGSQVTESHSYFNYFWDNMLAEKVVILTGLHMLCFHW